MPTYEYYCEDCDKDIEVFQSMKDDPLKVCPECDSRGNIKRKISGGAGIIFKGSGFYETDYKRATGKKSESESDSAAKAKPKESKGADAPKASKKSDGK